MTHLALHSVLYKPCHVSLNPTQQSRDSCHLQAPPSLINTANEEMNSSLPRSHSRAEIIITGPPSILTCPLSGAGGTDGGSRLCCPLGIPTPPRRIWRSFGEKEVHGGSNQDWFPGGEGAGVSVGSLVAREVGDPSIHPSIYPSIHSFTQQIFDTAFSGPQRAHSLVCKT